MRLSGLREVGGELTLIVAQILATLNTAPIIIIPNIVLYQQKLMSPLDEVDHQQQRGTNNLNNDENGDHKILPVVLQWFASYLNDLITSNFLFGYALCVL